MTIASSRSFTCAKRTVSRREFTSSRITSDPFTLHLEDAWVEQ